MDILEFTFTDTVREREVPVCVYLPKNTPGKLPVVIFGPGYQDQHELGESNIKLGYKNYNYLAEYFIQKGHVFISVQHDILGDKDGLETIDHSLPQFEARKHLYVRGEENILFVIKQLKVKLPQLNLENFIISGHSNGGDIAKYFANNHPENITHVIAFDARRCLIKPGNHLKILMFEATDTSTDPGVIPDQGTEENPKRKNLEWVIIKPKNALHASYSDTYITGEIRTYVLGAINWFLHN